MLRYYNQCILVVSLLFVFQTNNGAAQPSEQNPSNHSILVQNLERVLSTGNKRTLRDIGSLLEKKGIDKDIRFIIDKYTLFTKQELDINKVNKRDFLVFFYDNQHLIRYSELFGAFYITPVEERTTDYKVPPTPLEINQGLKTQLISNINKFVEGYKNKNIKKIEQAAAALADLENHEAHDFLKKQLLNPDGEIVFKNQKQAYFTTIIKALEDKPDYVCYKKILQLLSDKTISLEEVRHSLSKITNIYIEDATSIEDLTQKYAALEDSLNTLSAIRAHGYNLVFPFRDYYFFEPVDYYGKIFCMSDDKFWITQNAIADLLENQHPRILLYLASYIYRHRDLSPNEMPFDAVASFKKATHFDFSTDNWKQKDYQDFLFFWWQNYQNYEWSEQDYCYVNKEERLARLKEYEKHFRRLNSKNDSVAVDSYRLLTEGRPNEITELVKKYKSLLRTVNKTIPSLKVQYLEQLAELTTFCKENNLLYDLPSDAKNLINKLTEAEYRKEAFAIENELIAQTQIQDLTALEYYALLHSNQRDLNVSLSRIIDRVYSKYWNEILSDPKKLRTYLKKAHLFQQIGASGVCNNYLNKFDVQNANQQEQLQILKNLETDEQVKNQIVQLVANDDSSKSVYALKVSDFLKDPSKFNKIELQILPQPTVKELDLIANAIQKENDTQILKKYFTYLTHHSSVQMVPTLYKLIDSNKIFIESQQQKITIGDRVVPILEDIYNYSFASTDATMISSQEWKNLWKTKRKKYEKWSTIFLQQKLQVLQAKDSLNIEELNNLVEDAQNEEALLPQCLDLIKKIYPRKDIRIISLEKKLSLQTDLAYFQGLELSYKQLDDIPKFFEIDDTPTLIDFLEQESQHFDMLEKGMFINNLFQTKWFLDYVLSGKISVQRVGQYLEYLKHYLNESDYLSEYEEQRILQNQTSLESIGKPLKEKLEMSLALDADEKLKMNIQQGIIARIKYDEIGEVLEFLPYLSSRPTESPYSFLQKDFGLPIFEINDKEIERLKERHQNLNEFDFYQQYLQDFGIDFLDKDENLDFNKIYQILQFENVAPFSGLRGIKRDYFVYGTIKLLELHFKNRLGFHEKLNESQTFYTFTSNKRAKAWMQYLKEQQLVEPSIILSPSFNSTKPTY